MKRNTLYILDDSELDLAILNEIFKRDFQVTCFSSANLLLSALREQHQQVCSILLDVCLNRRNEGLSILRRLQEHPNFSNIPIILIASDANRENVMDGIELGAIDFLAKPVNPHYVRERVLNTVAAVWNEAPPEQSKKDSSVEANSEKPTHLPPLFEEETPYALSSSGPIGSTGPFFLLPEDIESISSGWIKRLVMLCQYRTSLSLGQVRNIQELTALLAKQYVMDHPNGALTEVDAKMIGVAATFYDIGLIGIPDDILRGGIHQPSPGQEIYLKHADIGREIFQNSETKHPFLHYCADIAYWHHKNYDGTGYPHTDTCVEIPICAQLVRTALRITYHMRLSMNHTDRFQRVLRAITFEAGHSISPDMYQTVERCKDQLELLLRVQYPQ